jgi:hypothetical protein
MAIVQIIDADGVSYTEKEYADHIRKKYVENPPAGYTADEIENMSDEDLLDMDYFLNE